jgi:hypothetical protein
MVGVSVMVRVMVALGDKVGATTVTPGFGGVTAGVVPRVTKYTRTAPMATNNASNPSAAGRLKVTSGMREPCTGFAARGPAFGLISLPHTWQRFAFSLTRDPQVGQIFVGEVGLVVVIILRGI